MSKSIKIILILLLITSLFLITSCKDKYTVTFKDYNGTVLKEEKIEEGKNATPPINPTREGYTFTGWSEEFTNIQKDTVIIAQYEQIINKYKVTFKTNCETTIEEEYYEKGNKIKEPTNLTKLGYTFLGWYVNEEKWSFIGYVITDNMTLEAKWEPIKYNISYELNGGIANNPTTYTIEDNIILNNPTKENYTFVGWTTPENNIPNLNVNISNETQDKTFTANYQINTYTITYELNGGIANNPTTYTIEDNIILNNPTKEGYTFIGWTTPENNIPNLNVNISNETQDKAFTANYQINTYNITYELNGGIVNNPTTYTIEDNIVLNNPTKEGYNFFGWITPENNEPFLNISIENEIENKHFIATWTNLDFNLKETEKYEVIGMTNSFDTKIIIPEYYDHKKITSIAASAFYSCNSLTSIVIPNSVTSIGDSAFEDCYSLTIYCESTSKPSGWDSNWNYSNRPVYFGVNENNFIEIDNLQYILDLENNTAIVSRYTGIEKIVEIPSTITHNNIEYNVTSIGNAAFSSCDSLTSIVIPNSVTSVGNYAFDRCTSLTIYCESTSKPSGWDSNWNSYNRPVYFGVNENNFVEIDNLQYILDLENNTAIVSRYTGIEETVEILSTITHNNIEYNVTSIGNYAFSSCNSLTSIVIPNSVTSIGYWAFRYCHSLTNIVIPNGVTSIGNAAFSSCSRLTSIVIPNSVTSIENYAFSYCSRLTIYCESISKPSGWDSNWNYSNRPVYFGVNENNFVEIDILQYILDLENNTAIVSRYTGIEETVEIPSTITHNNIEYNVTSIGDSAFEYCTSLTNITIPESVTNIGNSAFRYCNSLTIYCETSLQPSGWAYDWNYSNRPVYFGVNENNFVEIDILQYILDLKNNTAIVSRYTGIEETVEIPSTITHNNIEYSVTSIGADAFSSCNSLTSIVIPNSVTSIGYWAFRYCHSLTNIVIPSSVTSIGDSAFEYCTSLTSIVIPNSVTSIGNYAFSCCYSLTSIVIPNSVTSIGEYAFERCTSLTSIVIPNSVTSIGDGAFYGCLNLTSIVIPNSVTSIGAGAFNDCGSLTSIVIPNSVTSIGNAAFSSCSCLTNIVIPNSVTSIGGNAFYSCDSLTSIVIPNSVTSIGNYAFSCCYSLTSIVIPNSVTSIGEEAFYYCNNLTIYCETSLQPSGWNTYWTESDRPIYWAGQWEYDGNGKPIPLI